MDRNSIIGISLIFLLLLGWQRFMAPSEEELAEQQRIQDSIAFVKQTEQQKKVIDTTQIQQETVTTVEETVVDQTVNDSIMSLQLAGSYGPFAPAASGTSELITVENDLLKLEIDTKGGRIVSAEVKNYSKATYEKNAIVAKTPLILLEDKANKFEYILPVVSLPSGGINTKDLFFTVVSSSANSVVLRAPTSNGGYFEQSYNLKDGTYQVDYDIKMKNLNNVLAANAETITLNWENNLDKIERSARFERMHSTTHFKTVDGRADRCSLSRDDDEIVDEPLQWVATNNQFFSTIIKADQAFAGGEMEIVNFDKDDDDLKLAKVKVAIPLAHQAEENFGMTMYVGPNEFDRLRNMGDNIQEIIPYGGSILGTINRWVVRPIFAFLAKLIGNMGITILLLTLIVKAVLYPLTYKMLYSQSKMSALKPRIEKLKEKNKDDQQAQQMATMKLYQEYGVNPLGGCLPMVVQMPIWIALFRFFPAAIEFRQQSFLWAPDLSSYDAVFNLPFELPLGIGNHISLFTVLWVISTLVYTYYNSRHMDMSANPAMKYMQYFMPIMFLGYFNSYASGLTAYYLMSNILNITQTVVTKNFIIDQEKIDRKLQAYKEKPKKKKKAGGFRDRLQQALEEQQKIQKQQEDFNKNKKKK